ncbi:MAG: tRNA (guanosine(46)-N7)-methyltransferase TrmB [Halobacteriovoraceae bacterium]|nr:tRNA (guanosine(46)-N7)-methyltransferase TrmB [Halobacteriovoraceae bacterium]
MVEKSVNLEAKSEKKKSNDKDRAFSHDFQYSHDNPYHEKLEIFDHFVLRDDEGETYQNKWQAEVFNNQAPLEVEIGTGYGHFMIEHTQKHPHINFVGLDHRFKRSFHLAKKLAKLEHKNFRYLRARGERLGFLFGEDEVSKIYYFFPDPWPKKRHRKKRLFQKRFLDEAFRVLKPGGEILVKTDHDDYFSWMLDELKNEKRFKLELKTFDLHTEAPEHFLSSFVTKFEKIFLEKNVKIKALTLKSLK